MTYQDHFKACWPYEGVGYVKDGEFFPLKNLSSETHRFSVDPTQLAGIEPDALLHSHTAGVEPHTQYDLLRSPSKTDMEQQQAMNIPWGICVTDGSICEDPVMFGSFEGRLPYEGREFIFNVYDCWELCRDWMYREKDVVLGTLPRNPLWNREGADLLEHTYEAYGFEKVALKDVQAGDILFYRVRSPVINHVAVYIGGNQVLGHWVGRLSCIEPFGKWAGYCEYAVRHKGTS